MVRNWIPGTIMAGVVACGIAAKLMAVEAPIAPKKPATHAAQDESADVAAIRANVAAFTKAYEAKDVKALSELFAPNAKLITEDNDVIEGREAIGATFETLFADE